MLPFVHFGDDWVAGSEVGTVGADARAPLISEGIRTSSVVQRARFWRRGPAKSASRWIARCFCPCFRLFFTALFAFDLCEALAARQAADCADRRAHRALRNSAAPAQWMLPACCSRKVPLLINVHSRFYHTGAAAMAFLGRASGGPCGGGIVGRRQTAFDGWQEAGRVAVVYNGVRCWDIAAGRRQRISFRTGDSCGRRGRHRCRLPDPPQRPGHSFPEPCGPAKFGPFLSWLREMVPSGRLMKRTLRDCRSISSAIEAISVLTAGCRRFLGGAFAAGSLWPGHYRSGFCRYPRQSAHGWRAS